MTHLHVSYKASIIACIIVFVIAASILVYGQSSHTQDVIHSTIMLEYENIFYRFKYPNTYNITSENIIAEHIHKSGLDLYGTTEIHLEYFEGSNNEIIIASLPNTRNLSPTDVIEEEKNAFETDKELPSDTQIDIKICNIPAVQTYLSAFDREESFRLGSRIVTIPTQNLIYTVSMDWASSNTNDQRITDQTDFVNIVATFCPKVE
jgi:hypothetical protein